MVTNCQAALGLELLLLVPPPGFLAQGHVPTCDRGNKCDRVFLDPSLAWRGLRLKFGEGFVCRMLLLPGWVWKVPVPPCV